jgi:hypothetical protein
MKKNLLNLVFLLMGITQLQAQTVFYTQDFASGIPASWSNIGGVTTPNFTTRKWDHHPTTQGVRWNGQPAFASTTVANGYAFFFCRPSNTALTFDTKLTSNAIDCSGRSDVWLRFESQYAYFTASTIAQVGISTDSINFVYDTIFTNVTRNNLSTARQITELNITSLAANQPKVYIQFRWIGAPDYYDWKLDDITLATGSLKPKNNITIDETTRPQYYAVPESQKQPIVLAAYVKNIGVYVQKNVKLTATVKDQTNTTVYTADATIPTVEVDSTRLIEVTNSYTPAAAGNYTITYLVSQDSVDNEPANNTASQIFKVEAYSTAGNNYSLATTAVNSGYILMNNIPGSSGTFNNESVAAVYYIPNGSTTSTQYMLDSITVRFAKGGTASTFDGKMVSIVVYKWVDADNNSVIDNSELSGQVTGETYVGANDLTLTAAHNVSGSSFSPPITISLPNFAGDPGIILQGNTRYVVTVQQTGIIYNTADLFYIAETNNPSVDRNGIASYYYDKDRTKTSVYQVKQKSSTADRWYWNSFSNQPHISMKLRDQFINIRPVEKGKFDMTVFPNPSIETLNWEINLNKTAKQVVYQVTDMMGRIVFSTKKSDILNDKFSLNVTNFANGNYNLSVMTPEGTRTETFIVNK